MERTSATLLSDKPYPLLTLKVQHQSVDVIFGILFFEIFRQSGITHMSFATPGISIDPQPN
jgi:hypothetical protein